jgi:hypothetical protein
MIADIKRVSPIFQTGIQLLSSATAENAQLTGYSSIIAHVMIPLIELHPWTIYKIPVRWAILTLN